MKIVNDYYDFRISGHFLSAIINGDYSGLTDTECIQLDSFIDDYSLLKNSIWDVDTAEDQDSHFAECDITGLYSDCYSVKLHFLNQNEEITA